MKSSLVIWRRWMKAIFNPLNNIVEKNRRRKSQISALVFGAGRDAFRYYLQGKSVVVAAELSNGPVERIIFRGKGFHWVETGERLTEQEATSVIQTIGSHLDSKRIKWAFAEERVQDSR